MFDKKQFQSELIKSLSAQISNDSVISNLQLKHFMEEFYQAKPQSVGLEEVLNNQQFAKALRMLFFYNTLALVIHDPLVYAAAVEVFPLTDIPGEYATMFSNILDYVQDHPLDVQSVLEKALPDPLSSRLGLLQQSLRTRLGDVL